MSRSDLGFFISPEGKWNDIGHGNHEEWSATTQGETIEDLLNLGWIRISGDSIQSAKELSDQKIMMLVRGMMKKGASLPIVVQMGKKIVLVKESPMGRPEIKRGKPALAEVRKMKSKKLIQEEIRKQLAEQKRLDENFAQKISDAVGKLVDFWKKKKQDSVKSDFVLDQASSALKRSIMTTFADINRRLDRGKFADVEKQKTGGQIKDYILESIYEELQPEENKEKFMVKGNLRHLANYATHLYHEIDELDDVEEWVQEQISNAAHDLGGIRHYYEEKLHSQGYTHGPEEDEMMNQALTEEEKMSLQDRIDADFYPEIREGKEEDNPWAICNASVGQKDKAKFERCVKQVKKQKGK